ncbi:MAG: Isoleucine--tRNA ligase [Myxococcota bacterium]|nr:Isoleucine--tRNA ligase [Myxococcota bacterium]
MLLAPILSHTAAEAWSHLHSGAEGGGAASHVLLQDFPAPRERDESALLERWERLLAVRGVVLKHLEEARAQKQIGSSQEAHVEIRASGGTLELLRGREAFAAELCITSSASVVEDAAVPADPSQVKVTVSRAGGEKCPRCWNYRLHQGSDPHHPGLCLRCTRAVTGGAEP